MNETETTVVQIRADMLFTPEQLRLLDAACLGGESRCELLRRILQDEAHRVITEQWQKERGK